MNQRRPFKSIVAAFTVLTFFVTSLGVSPNVFAAAAMPEVALPYQVKLGENLRMAIPQEFGKLENFSAGEGPAIFHIQTAHGHYQSQQQIRSLLHYLDKNYGVKTLLMEGSAFELDPELIRFFPEDKAKTLKAADELTRHALLKGPELYLLDQMQYGVRSTEYGENSEKRDAVRRAPQPKRSGAASVGSAVPVVAYGIEELQSYRANGVAFAEVLRAQQKTGQFLADMNMQVERLSSHYLNKDLRDFLRRVEGFEKNQIPLDTWLANLKGEAAKRLEIDLASPSYQLEWPMMVRISKIQELRAKFDKQKFSKERDEFLKSIRRFLPGNVERGTLNDPLSVTRSPFPAIESLLRNDSMSQQLPDPETGLLFEDMIKYLPENFNYDAFPNVRFFIGMLLLQSELKSGMLMQEIQKLSEKITTKLTRNKEEAKLVALLADHRLLQKLFALELAPEDYEKIERRKAEGVRSKNTTDGKGQKGYSLKPSELVRQLMGTESTSASRANDQRGTPYALHRTKQVEFSHIPDLDQLFDLAMQFYAGVKERDTFMMQRVEERLKETGATQVAVITGGFHSAPFQKYFTDKKYTYALISPRITGADEAGHQSYIQNTLMSTAKELRGTSYSVRRAEQATRESVSLADSQVLAPKNVYGVDQAAMRAEVREIIAGVRRSETRSPDDAERVREAEHALQEEAPHQVQATPQDAADVDYWNKHGKQEFYAGIDEPLRSRSEARLSQDSFEVPVSRRDFLRTAALATAGFFLLPAGTARAVGTNGVPTTPAKVSVRTGDRRLFIQDRKSDGTLGAEYALTMKGMNWSPASKDSNPTSNPTGFRDEFFKWYQTDIPLMAKMGVNVVRVYHDFGTDTRAFQVLDMFYKYGIKVIVQVDSPLHGTVANTANVTTVVNAYKNHPAILMWGIGNEWDLKMSNGKYYWTFNTLSDAAAWVQSTALTIKSLDSNHAVSTMMADPHIPDLHPLSQEAFPYQFSPSTLLTISTKDIVNTLCPAVDVWGLQIYRNKSFGDLFQQWRSISTKPMYIGEFGADSYDHLTGNQNYAMQADMNAGLWDETFLDLSAERTNGAAIGAVSFEFNDEWWKNGTPGVQSISYESNPGQPDSVNDEEHFGHFTIDRVQKTSATAISNRFNNGPAAVALNASPLLTVSSQDQGSAVIKIGDKTVFSRGGGQWGARGINVFVLDEATGIRVKEFRSFDTYVYPNLFTNLVSYLNGLPSGSIVAFSIADEGGLWREPWRADGGYPEPNALSFKTLLGSSAWGSTQVGNVRYQSGWAFLAKKGAGKLDEGISVAAYTTATVQYSPALTTNVSTGLRTAYAQVQPFQVKGAQLVGANAEVQFASVNGVVYQVEYSNDLKTWYVARSGIIAEGAVTTFVDDGTFTGAAPNTVPKRFYRVKATGQVFRSEARSSLRTSPGGIVKNTKNGTVSVRSEARVWSEADSLGDIETEVARVVAKNVQQDTNQVYDGMLRDFGMTTIDMTILELALESKFGFPTHSLDGLVNPSASVRAISGEIFSRLQSRSPRSEPRAEKDGEKLPSLDTFLRYIAKNMSDPKQKRQREMFLRKDSLSEVEFLIRQLQDHPDRFGLDSDDRKLLELMLRDLIHPRGEVTYFLDRFLDIGIHIKFNPSLLLAAIHAFVETGEVEELKKIPPASRSESRSPDDAERVREAEHVLREKSPRPIQQTPQDAADVDYWNKHGKQGFYAGIDESLSGRSEARSFIEEQAARYETLFADGKPVLAFEDVDLKTPGELDLSKGVAFTYREDSRQFVLRTANGRLGVTIRSVDGGEMNYISTGDSAKNPIAFTGDGARVLLKGHFLFAWSGSRKATGQSLTLVDLVNQNVLYSGESSKFGAENPEMSRLRSEMRKVLEDGEVLKPGQSQSAPVLVFNAGSSTIKWQVIDMATEVMIAKGKVDIGSGEGKAANYDEAIARILGELSERHLEPVAVGHRVVHGGESFKQPAIVSDPVIAAIEQVTELAPLHNPANLMCIRAAQKAFPKVGHVAVFDTAFHQTMPPKAFRYAIPNEYYTDHKVRKYGFHGTSHRYVMEEFARIQGKKPEDVSVVTAHLGNGASIAAIQNGKSIDTSMGLTPLEGVAMGTRSGDIDAGAVLYLANKLGKTPSQMSDLLNKQSGLKGLAGISDVQDLTRKANAGDEAAILALEIFIYRVLKYIYAYDGILGGADAIILTGGVGENHNYVHPRLLQRLSEYFQATRRPEKMPWIGSIKTNEELVIARDTLAVLSVAGLMSVAAQDVASRSESRGEDKETAEQKAIREFRVKFERQVNRVAAEGISQIKSLEGYNPEDPWAIAIQVSLNGNAPQSEPGITLEHVDQTGFYALSFLDVLWQGSFAHRIFSFDSILPVLDVKRKKLVVRVNLKDTVAKSRSEVRGWGALAVLGISLAATIAGLIWKWWLDNTASGNIRKVLRRMDNTGHAKSDALSWLIKHAPSKAESIVASHVDEDWFGSDEVIVALAETDSAKFVRAKKEAMRRGLGRYGSSGVMKNVEEGSRLLSRLGADALVLEKYRRQMEARKSIEQKLPEAAHKLIDVAHIEKVMRLKSEGKDFHVVYDPGESFSEGVMAADGLFWGESEGSPASLSVFEGSGELRSELRTVGLEEQLNVLAADTSTGLRKEQIREILDAGASGNLKLKGEDIDIIKIVDGREVVIGAIDRNIAHKYALLHRVPTTFIVTPEGKFLFQRRAHNIVQRLKLALFGGHVQTGSNYRETVKEEIVDELGLPKDWKVDDSRLKVIRTEGGFAWPTAQALQEDPNLDKNNREMRSHYVYFASAEEVAKIRAMGRRLEHELTARGEAGFKQWLESEQKAKNGLGEVWSIHEYSYDEIMAPENKGKLATDLLLQLLYHPKNQDVRDALKQAVVLPELVNLMARQDKLPSNADLIMVFGGGDIDGKVPEAVADMYMSYPAGNRPRILLSGGGKGERPEAVEYQEKLQVILESRGVHNAEILTETTSMDMKTNVENSRAVLAEKKLDPQSIAFVHAPFHVLKGSVAVLKAFPGKITAVRAAYVPDFNAMDDAKRDKWIAALEKQAAAVAEMPALGETAKEVAAKLAEYKVLVAAPARSEIKIEMQPPQRSEVRTADDVIQQIKSMSDADIAALKVTDLVELTREMIRTGAFKKFQGMQEKMVVFSAGPGTGKGTVLKETFKGEASDVEAAVAAGKPLPRAALEDLVDVFVLYHSRKARIDKDTGISEKDGEDYQFRNNLDYGFETEEEKVKHGTYLNSFKLKEFPMEFQDINRQAQAMAVDDFQEPGVAITDVSGADIGKLQPRDTVVSFDRWHGLLTVTRHGTGYQDTLQISVPREHMGLFLPGDSVESVSESIVHVTRQIRGIKGLFSGSRLAFLEGGYEWFQYLKENPKYSGIWTCFLALFDKDELSKRVANEAAIDARFTEPEENALAHYAMFGRMDAASGEIDLNELSEMEAVVAAVTKGESGLQVEDSFKEILSASNKGSKSKRLKELNDLLKKWGLPSATEEQLENATSLSEIIRPRLRQILLENSKIIKSKHFMAHLELLLKKYDYVLNPDRLNEAEALAYEIQRRLLFRDPIEPFLDSAAKPTERFNRVLTGIFQNLTKDSYADVVVKRIGYSREQRNEAKAKAVDQFIGNYLRYVLRAARRFDVRKDAIAASASTPVRSEMRQAIVDVRAQEHEELLENAGLIRQMTAAVQPPLEMIKNATALVADEEGYASELKELMAEYPTAYFNQLLEKAQRLIEVKRYELAEDAYAKAAKLLAPGDGEDETVFALKRFVLELQRLQAEYPEPSHLTFVYYNTEKAVRISNAINSILEGRLSGRIPQESFWRLVSRVYWIGEHGKTYEIDYKKPAALEAELPVFHELRIKFIPLEEMASGLSGRIILDILMTGRSEARAADGSEMIREAEHAYEGSPKRSRQVSGQDAVALKNWVGHGKQEFYTGVDQSIRGLRSFESTKVRGSMAGLPEVRGGVLTKENLREILKSGDPLIWRLALVALIKLSRAEEQNSGQGELRSETRGLSKKVFSTVTALKHELRTQKKPKPYSLDGLQTRFDLTTKEARSVMEELGLSASGRSEARLTAAEEKRFQKAMKDLQPKWWDGWFVRGASYRKVDAIQTLEDLKNVLKNVSEKAPAVSALVEALKDTDSEVGSWAAQVLGELGDLSAAAALRQVAQQGSSLDLSHRATVALVKLNDIPGLSALLGSKDEWVKNTAKNALNVAGNAGQFRSEMRQGVTQGTELQKVLKDLQPHWKDRISWGGGVERRVAAAQKLGESGNPGVVAALADRVKKDKSPEVQKEALLALGEIGGLRAIAALKDLLMNGDPALFEFVAQGIEMLGVAAMPVWAEAMGSENIVIREFSVKVLTGMGAYSTLAKGMDSQYWDVRIAGVMGLQRLFDTGGLVRALHDPYIPVREAAVRALIQNKDIPGLTEASKNRYEWVSRAAQEGLKSVKHARTIIQDKSILQWKSKHGKSLQEILDQFVKEYDFRGFDGADDVNFPQQVDEELLRWVGNALGSVKFTSRRHDRSVQLNVGDTFVIAGDNGPSTQKFKNALIQGLRDAGVNVIDLGVTVSGHLYKSISNLGARGGLYVTRSHVEVGTNGAKPNIGGITLYGEMLQQAKARILGAQYAKADQPGTLNDSQGVRDQSREMYLKSLTKSYSDLVELLKSAGMKVAFNLNSGSATEYVSFFQGMFGSDVTLLKSEGDSWARKGLADPTRMDKKALAHPEANMIQYSKDHPDVFVLNFDLDVDRVSLLQNGNLYLGDEMFYCMIEYMLTIDPYKDMLKKIYPDSRMKIEFGQLVRHFGGIAKRHPKGHSKVKATIDVLLSQMVKTGGFADVAALLKKYPGFRIAQSEYSLHFFLTSDKGEAFDDALEFSLFWLNVFAKIKLKHGRTDWSYGDYVRDLKTQGIIQESIQIKEQRTPMPDEVKGPVMERMKDAVLEYFEGRPDFVYVPDWEADYESAMKPYTLINIEGVYHFVTPMGEIFWGQSNTSPKVSFGTQSTSAENTRKLAGIVAALMIHARQKVAPQAPKFHPLETADLFKAWLSETHKVSFAEWSSMYSDTREAMYDAWLSEGLEANILTVYPTDETALSEFKPRSEVRNGSTLKIVAAAMVFAGFTAFGAEIRFVKMDEVGVTFQLIHTGTPVYVRASVEQVNDYMKSRTTNVVSSPLFEGPVPETSFINPPKILFVPWAFPSSPDGFIWTIRSESGVCPHGYPFYNHGNFTRCKVCKEALKHRSEVRRELTEAQQFQKAMKDLQPKWLDRVFWGLGVTRRAGAAQKLGQSENPAAIYALFERVKNDRSLKVKKESFIAIGKIGGVQAVVALKDLSEFRPRFEVRDDAVQKTMAARIKTMPLWGMVLSTIGLLGFLGWLSEQMSHSRWPVLVSGTVFIVLLWVATRVFEFIWGNYMGDGKIYRKVRRAMRDLEPKWWDRVFFEAGAVRRAAAAIKLGEYKDPLAIPALIEALKEWKIRKPVVAALEKFEPSDVVPALMNDLKINKASSVLASEVEVLGNLHASVAVPVFIQMLNSMLKANEYPDVEIALEVALGRIHDVHALPALAAALESEKREIRNAAVSALRMMEASAIPVWAQARNSKYPNVREAANNVLEKFKAPVAVAKLPELVTGIRSETRNNSLSLLNNVARRSLEAQNIAAFQELTERAATLTRDQREQLVAVWLYGMTQESNIIPANGRAEAQRSLRQLLNFMISENRDLMTRRLALLPWYRGKGVGQKEFAALLELLRDMNQQGFLKEMSGVLTNEILKIETQREATFSHLNNYKLRRDQISKVLQREEVSPAVQNILTPGQKDVNSIRSEMRIVPEKVEYDETAVERVTRWFRAGILPLRVMLSVSSERALVFLARLGIPSAQAAEAALAARNVVTLVSRPETLSPERVSAARAVFGETLNKTSDMFILTAGIALDRGLIAAMRTIFGDAPMVVLTRNQADRDFLEKFNKQLSGAKRPEILVARGLGEAQGFVKQETKRLRTSGVISVKVKALVAAGDPLAMVLKEKIPDMMLVTDVMFGKFLNQAGVGISKLVSDIQAQFAIGKSA